MMQPGSRKRAATQALVLLALPALAAAFAPTGFFSKVVGVKNSPGTPSLRPRARLAAPLSARSGASRLVCSNDGREAVKHADHQYLVERGACGVGFIASKKNEASHDIITKATTALGCMEHRGACGGDYDSGDGSGVMTMIPWELFGDMVKEGDRKNTGVGMIFLPKDPAKAKLARETVEELAVEEGFTVVGWRKVPTTPGVLGPMALDACPVIEQVVLKSNAGLEGDELEKGLYTIKRCFLTSLTKHGLDWVKDNVYICSLSSRTIIYKGMVRSVILAQFYNDLTNPEYKSRFAIYHRRFSTNTVPRWPLAQPFRTIGHNGEINTLLGNINWMQAREAVMDQTIAFPNDADLTNLDPLSDARLSDSANLDLCAELLIRSGKSPMEALMILVPEAYKNQPDLDDKQAITDFYNYYSGLQEAWDGPALLVFSDGKNLGAALDRNGLRPARFLETDDLVCMMSETGVVPGLDEAKITHKGRLGPGQMISMDLETGEFLENYDVKEKVAKKYPYGEWLKKEQTVINKMPMTGKRLWGDDEINLVRNQVSMGWSSEDMEMQIADMASTGKETTFCMGDDAPLAVLSDKPHVLYNYFKQRFAQVTNPAIDPLRENLVMSLAMTLGKKANIVDEPTAAKAQSISIETPVMNENEMDAMRNSGRKTETLSTFWAVSDGPDGLAKAVKKLQADAEAAVKAGAEILILSDFTPEAALKDKAYIPPLLAVGAVHHHLLSKKLRLEASIVAETGQAWSTHHIACLVGFGASAVHPYAAFEGVRSWYHSAKTQRQMKDNKIPAISVEAALDNYRESLDGGLFKIMSKIGISLMSSYHAAQIFEAIGLGKEVIDLGFPGTVSRVGGLNAADLANEVISCHASAFPETPLKALENYGFIKYFTGREYHHNSPPLTKMLHKALREKDLDTYKLFQESLKTAPLSVLRDLLEFKSDREPIPLDKVQPVEDIMKRFATGGMSLGALSREAHETLAVAVNRIGGKSNSGEGGEDAIRQLPITDVDAEGNSPTFPHLKGLKNGDVATSKIKQVASGRFGVSPAYLMSADQIEIKLAQGAKPGEGGQLPGAKIDNYIATLRLSKPGVTLISPPPHHDIYSIEDLSQLIYDLHTINPTAKVSVKLVAGSGIGTIAAGVAKANADVIQISGHDGGTGASPLSSIKHAGAPWELGLTEVHRTLIESELRERVLLRVDGGLKTGWDVVMGALMGGEEYGFGTIAMIAEGCIMARICHTNNCPVGVTTQKEALRKKFPGTPADVVNYFEFVAQEVRSILAHLGYEKLEDLVGRGDILKYRADAKPTKTTHLDLSFLTDLPDVKTNRDWVHLDEANRVANSNGPILDDDLLADSKIASAIEKREKVKHEVDIVNTDRSVGGRVSGVIAKKWGNKDFAEGGGELHMVFSGSAGQSFGAFTLPGMKMEVVGEVNDYVGKGMHGGEIIVRPPPASVRNENDNTIVGNTALYGCTGGKLFAAGRAGERFAVRNSAAQTVVEGSGDHALEYMTGGVVVMLGKTGRNVGAGMTGGIAYLLEEEDGYVDKRINKEIVKVQRIPSAAGEKQLKTLIEEHVAATGSTKGKSVLENWGTMKDKFWQIVPPAEAKTAVAVPEGAAEPVSA